MMKIFGWIISAALLMFAVGCAGHTQSQITEEVFAPQQVEIVPERPTTNGSLWTESGGALFNDLKARRVGDILTVAIFERASASKEASTSTGRSSSASAGINNLFGLEKQIATINGAIDPGNLIGTQYDNEFTGSGSTSRREDLVATITTRVVDVLPNGNLRIDGHKSVTVNNEQQLIRLSGIVRPTDVSSNNVVDSSQVLDAQIVYTGKGVISDKQKQGWLVRILDNVWPF